MIPLLFDTTNRPRPPRCRAVLDWERARHDPGGPSATRPTSPRPRALNFLPPGTQEATETDLNFNTPELREYVRYRRLGVADGAMGGDYDLWNNAHSADLADYVIEKSDVLYDSSTKQ